MLNCLPLSVVRSSQSLVTSSSDNLSADSGHDERTQGTTSPLVFDPNHFGSKPKVKRESGGRGLGIDKNNTTIIRRKTNPTSHTPSDGCLKEEVFFSPRNGLMGKITERDKFRK